MTKKQALIYERWYDSALTNLFQCYRAPSIYKMNAMERVKERMSKVDGYALKLLATTLANSQLDSFTNKETKYGFTTKQHTTCKTGGFTKNER